MNLNDVLIEATKSFGFAPIMTLRGTWKQNGSFPCLKNIIIVV